MPIDVLANPWDSKGTDDLSISGQDSHLIQSSLGEPR